MKQVKLFVKTELTQVV